MTTAKISDVEAVARLGTLDPEIDGVRDGGPIRALSEAVDRRNADQREIETLVVWGREQGATWIEIGLALGVSPQAARQRYREVAVRSAAPDSAARARQSAFELHKNARGTFQWRLTFDGEVVATSIDYPTKAMAVAGVRALKEQLSSTSVEDLASV